MQVYVAIHDGHRTKALRIHLAKGTRSRLQEDDVASRLVHHFFTVQPSALFTANNTVLLYHFHASHNAVRGA